MSLPLGLLTRNARDAALPLTVGGSAAGVTAVRHQRRREVPATAAGAAGAEAAWRGIGLGVIQHQGKLRERPTAGQSRSQYQKLVSQHKHAHGVGGLQGPELRAALQRRPEYFRTYPRELGGWRWKRLLGQMSGRRGLALEAAAVAGGAAAGRHVSKRTPLVNAARWGGGLTAAAVAGGTASHARTHDVRRDADMVVGGLAGQGAYQAHNYGLKHLAANRHRTSGVSRSRTDKLLKPVKAEHGAFTAQMYRNYPHELPAARVHRYLGRVARGRTGMAVGAAATVAGAAEGARHEHRQMIGKSVEVGVREKKTRPVRAAEFGAGAAGVAWGAPRLKMVGPAIQRGARLAGQHGGANAARATLRAADTARAALIAGTAPFEQARRLSRVNHLVETIPASLRPAVATVAGVLLAAHAVPVRREQFVPVKEG